MDIKTIAPDFSVCGQLHNADIGILASQGYRSIIIARPDGESEDQPNSELIRRLAELNGMQVEYLPVIAGQLTDEHVVRFAKAIESLPHLYWDIVIPVCEQLPCGRFRK
jgi:sulfide:quinone oxidoreductase